MLQEEKIEALLAFMRERHAIYLSKQAGEPKPWTNDPVLQNFRFCNVYRELDTVTVWIRENIREPYFDHPNLWFMLCVGRQINFPETLSEIRWPIEKYNSEELLSILQCRARKGLKVYTGAYMLNNAWPLNWEGERDKPTFTAKLVLQSVWNRREKLVNKDTLKSFAATLTEGHGWGTFLAAQVVADLKYAARLSKATDWWDWAASGPGSRKGLNIICGRPEAAAWKEELWLLLVQQLRQKVNSKWEYAPLHAQDVQNCLCEFYKYTRGSSRNKYAGRS